MANILDDIMKTGFNIFGRFTNKQTFEAIVATTTLVASSDGVISPEERKKLVAFIASSDTFNVFGAEDIINLFNKFAQMMEFDSDIGKTLLLKEIKEGARDGNMSRLIVSIASAIAKADGDIKDSERAVVQEIAKHLGVASPV